LAALGGRDPVTSPTFTLAHKYRTSPPVTHVDLWRLDHLQEVVDLALEEELDEGGVVIVEWGDAAEPLYGAEALVVRSIGALLTVSGPSPLSAAAVMVLEAELLREALRAGSVVQVRILAIETAVIEVGVALADETGPLASVTARPAAARPRRCIPRSRTFCGSLRSRRHSSTPSRSTSVRGSSTGLRVGVATAKALAGALGLPVVTATSLECW